MRSWANSCRAFRMTFAESPSSSVAACASWETRWWEMPRTVLTSLTGTAASVNVAATSRVSSATTGFEILRSTTEAVDQGLRLEQVLAVGGDAGEFDRDPGERNVGRHRDVLTRHLLDLVQPASLGQTVKLRNRHHPPPAVPLNRHLVGLQLPASPP